MPRRLEDSALEEVPIAAAARTATSAAAAEAARAVSTWADRSSALLQTHQEASAVSDACTGKVSARNVWDPTQMHRHPEVARLGRKCDRQRQFIPEDPP